MTTTFMRESPPKMIKKPNRGRATLQDALDIFEAWQGHWITAKTLRWILSGKGFRSDINDVTALIRRLTTAMLVTVSATRDLYRLNDASIK